MRSLLGVSLPVSMTLALSSILSFVPVADAFSSGPWYSPVLSRPSVAGNFGGVNSGGRSRNRNVVLRSVSDATETRRELERLANTLNESLDACRRSKAVGFTDVKVRVGLSPTPYQRLGLLATTALSADSVALSVPFDEKVVISGPTARKTLESFLSKAQTNGADEYKGWTGDTGFMAMALLWELSGTSPTRAKRPGVVNEFMTAWTRALPMPAALMSSTSRRKSDDSKNDDPYEWFSHPLSTWTEEECEDLQNSSTQKVYRLLDDAEEDAEWWNEHVWSLDRDLFPEEVVFGNDDESSNLSTRHPCFSITGFLWALSMVKSRSIFADGRLQLVPVVDFANHCDECRADTTGAQEVGPAYFGAFGTTRGVQIRTPTGPSGIEVGEEVLVSYGPKSPIDFLLEHGFLPKVAVVTALSSLSGYVPSQYARYRGTMEAAELTFEISEADQFYEDKLDILENEVGGTGGGDVASNDDGESPVQSFGISSVDDYTFDSTNGNVAPMTQFLRLSCLGGKDAFLLESVFRSEVWYFMASPVSVANEEAVLTEISRACQTALEDMDGKNLRESLNLAVDDKAEDEDATLKAVRLSPGLSCAVVRTLERRALEETLRCMEREQEALDLKEYYQERRLRDLGLDADWDPTDNPDVGWGQTRAPGGGDLDW